jgi:hypothetical protein
MQYIIGLWLRKQYSRGPSTINKIWRGSSPKLKQVCPFLHVMHSGAKHNGIISKLVSTLTMLCWFHRKSPLRLWCHATRSSLPWKKWDLEDPVYINRPKKGPDHLSIGFISSSIVETTLLPLGVTTFKLWLRGIQLSIQIFILQHLVNNVYPSLWFNKATY